MADSNVATLPAEGFVRLPAILAVLPVSRTTWNARVRAGIYPKPTKLGPRVNAWRVDEIRALLENPPTMQGAPAPQRRADSTTQQEKTTGKKRNRGAAPQ